MNDTASAPPATTLAHSVILLAASLAAFAWNEPRLLAVVGWLAFVRKVYLERAQWLPIRFGWPNVVTTLRLLIVGWLGFVPQADGLVLAVVVLATFALDGIDGWIARTFGQSSTFGGEYDKEVDAFYVAMVGMLLYWRDIAGWWAIVPGLLRYLYIVVIAMVPVRGEVPRNRFARYSFGILAFAFTLAFVLPPTAARIAAAVGTAALCWSFAPSFVWSFRKPPSGP